MELNKIELLLDKYFEGQTSIAEEKELTNYFSASDVAQHLEQYKPLFGYFEQAKAQKLAPEISLNITQKEKKGNKNWIVVAASVVVLAGLSTFIYNTNRVTKVNQDLGSFNNPEIAFKETQKALQLLSQNVNVGIESVSYINEYEKSKNLIFKNQ